MSQRSPKRKGKQPARAGNRKTVSGPSSRPARFSDAERQRALGLVFRGVPRRKVAEQIGCSTESVRLWVRAAEQDLEHNRAVEAPATDAGGNSTAAAESKHGKVDRGAAESSTARADDMARAAAPTAPRSPGSGLGEAECAAILSLKRRHPTMGPAQIRAQLKRFKGWRVALRAIARVLRENGYDLQHRGGRPEESEPPRSWEAPYRGALWQMDFTEVRLPEGRRALGVILDDFSRYIVGCGLLTNPTSEDVVALLREAIRLHGKPLGLYTDRAGPFLAWGKPEGLQRFLEEELIEHHTTAAYRPQGRGKVEAVIATIKRELWEVEHFADEETALERLKLFVDRYNHQRAHLSLDGLTPADRFFGRWEKVLALVEAQSRRRQGIEALRQEAAISSEPLPPGRAEILRLVAVDGALELRFFGHRVHLGPIES